MNNYIWGCWLGISVYSYISNPSSSIFFITLVYYCRSSILVPPSYHHCLYLFIQVGSTLWLWCSSASCQDYPQNCKQSILSIAQWLPMMWIWKYRIHTNVNINPATIKTYLALTTAHLMWHCILCMLVYLTMYMHICNLHALHHA